MLFIFILLAHCLNAEAKLKVVTTTTDLKALVSAVGQNQVDVMAVAKGTQDPHHLEAKPSFMVRLRDADLILSQGLDLESAWLPLLIQGARNPKINLGTPGYLALGPALSPLEVATTKVSRADGDIHPDGNPHFQLDPIRLGQAALLIGERLGELDPNHKSFYLDNAKKLQKHFEQKTKEWKTRLDQVRVKEVVTYHKTLTYFLDRFGIEGNLRLEPKPGIPPTASHLVSVLNQMKTRQVKLVLIENLYDSAVGDKIKAQIKDAKIKSVPVSVEGLPEIKNNEELIEYLVQTIEGKR